MPTSFRWGKLTARGPLPSEPAGDVAYFRRLIEEQRVILDALPIGVAVFVDRKIVWVSRAFTTLLGYSLEEANGLSTTAIFADARQTERAIAGATAVMAEGGTYQADLLMRRKSGEEFWGQVTGRFLFVGRPELGIVWMVADVSARKQIEEALLLAQRRFETAQAQAKIGSWELGADPEDRYWSNEMYALYGFDPANGPPDAAAVFSHIHPDDHAAIRNATREAGATGRRVRAELRSHPSRGETRYFEVFVQSIADEQGRLLRSIGTTQDITERKRTEEALRLSERRLEAAQEHAKVGSWEFGPNLEVRYWSKQMFALFGASPEGGLPSVDSFLSSVHPDDREQLIEMQRTAIERHEACRVLFRANVGLGSPRYFEATMVPEYDEAGNLLRTSGTTQDVTERKVATDALRHSEQRLKRLLENSNDVFGTLDADGRQWSLRGRVKAMLGYEPAELEGSTALEFLHPDDVPEIQRVIGEAMRHPGVPYRTEYRFRHKQGHWIELEAVGTNWLDDPVIKGIVINVRQITERKQAELERSKLEQQLQQALKMEAIGRLAGGVAHDFNNLLTVIAGNVELAMGELEPASLIEQYLNDISGAASSAASLTRQLLAFSRRQLVEPKVVNLNELVSRLEKMLSRLIGEDVSLELRLSRDLGSVRIDPGQFDQVLINLAVNARDAMPKGGRLTIETRNYELDEGYCRLHRDVEPGRYVELVVADSGEGMTAEVLQHLFEPFFTTKAVGSGTGLGLSVTFGAVKQAGGTIETYSEPGHGTTFKIYLPRVDAEAALLQSPQVSVDALNGNESILIVEDNDQVRELTTEMLQRFGYHLLVARNGGEALQMVERDKPTLQLLLTDLVMPGMSGRELSERIRELYPEIAVLYCSGYTEDTFVRHGLASENLPFISKPFTKYQLALKVRLVLDEHRK